MGLEEALATIRAQFPNAPMVEHQHKEEVMSPSIDSQIIKTIREAHAPLLSYRDFMNKLPNIEYNELRKAIKCMREEGKIQTSDTGYRVVGETKVEQTSAKVQADKPIKERAKKTGIPCLCGCGNITNPGSFFMPGHDARVKGWVKKVNAGTLEADCLRVAIEYGAVVAYKGEYRLLTVAEIKKLVR